MTHSQERLKILARAVHRAAQKLEALEASQSEAASQLQADYLTRMRVAEEELAQAEILLLLAAEREGEWEKAESALLALKPTPAPQSAPARHTRAAKPSSLA